MEGRKGQQARLRPLPRGRFRHLLRGTAEALVLPQEVERPSGMHPEPGFDGRHCGILTAADHLPLIAD
jgi:hypothetical protein